MLDVAGRIQNSYTGLPHPDAVAVTVTDVPEPCAIGDAGENDIPAEVQALISV